MICVRVGDGLGNQLFNYAFGYALAKKNNTKLILDISSFDDAGSREYKLDEFSITFIEKKNWHNSPKAARVYKEICKRVFWSVHYEKKPYVYTPPEVTKYRNNYYKGWWQSDLYFKEYKEEIIQEFTPKQARPTIREIINVASDYTIVSVHIRRGDYIRINGCIDLSYYAKAIDWIKRRFEKVVFCFFSDDIPFCREHFKSSDGNYIFIENEKLIDIDEFCIMSTCDHNIIANSSFSWWAAYLNRNNNKCVIAPKVMCWDKDFYPVDWVKIDTQLVREN